VIRNEDCIKIINDKNILRDNAIIKIEIILEGKINVSLTIEKDNSKIAKLNLNNVSEFSISADSIDAEGYLVTHYKLFESNSGFYFSFDPYDEIHEVNLDDNNFFHFEEISLFFE